MMKIAFESVEQKIKVLRAKTIEFKGTHYIWLVIPSPAASPTLNACCS